MFKFDEVEMRLRSLIPKKFEVRTVGNCHYCAMRKDHLDVLLMILKPRDFGSASMLLVAFMLMSMSMAEYVHQRTGQQNQIWQGR
jgi:hypothetical protein